MNQRITLRDLEYLIAIGTTVDLIRYDEDLNIVDQFFGPYPIPGARMGYEVVSLSVFKDRHTGEPYLRINCR